MSQQLTAQFSLQPYQFALWAYLYILSGIYLVTLEYIPCCNTDPTPVLIHSDHVSIMFPCTNSETVDCNFKLRFEKLKRSSLSDQHYFGPISFERPTTRLSAVYPKTFRLCLRLRSFLWVYGECVCSEGITSSKLSGRLSLF